MKAGKSVHTVMVTVMLETRSSTRVALNEVGAPQTNAARAKKKILNNMLQMGDISTESIPFILHSRGYELKHACFPSADGLAHSLRIT